jgi:hypothetical protein
MIESTLIDEADCCVTLSENEGKARTVRNENLVHERGNDTSGLQGFFILHCSEISVTSDI